MGVEALTKRQGRIEPLTPWARRTVDLVGRHCRWDEGGQPFWSGEVEECINGRTVTVGAYFGVDVSPIVERLLDERQEDGGWNCERCNGSHRSSFDTTINVLEGLLECEKTTGGTPESPDSTSGGGGIPPGTGTFPQAEYRNVGCGAIPETPVPQSLALRSAARARLFPRILAGNRRGAGSTARRGYCLSTIPAVGGRHLATRLAA